MTLRLTIPSGRSRALSVCPRILVTRLHVQANVRLVYDNCVYCYVGNERGITRGHEQHRTFTENYWKGECQDRQPSHCTRRQRRYSPANQYFYAYKSSSCVSSWKPAFPAGAVVDPEGSEPSGNLKLFPKPRDCCRFCTRHESTRQRTRNVETHT